MKEDGVRCLQNNSAADGRLAVCGADCVEIVMGWAVQLSTQDNRHGGTSAVGQSRDKERRGC